MIRKRRRLEGPGWSGRGWAPRTLLPAARNGCTDVPGRWGRGRRNYPTKPSAHLLRTIPRMKVCPSGPFPDRETEAQKGEMIGLMLHGILEAQRGRLK